MIKCTYIISEEVRKKKIFIYGLEKDAIVSFTYLAFHDGNIDGFVDSSNRYIHNTFMNRQIISIEEFGAMENAILIVPEVYSKERIQAVVNKGIFYWYEILGINHELFDKDIHLYGLGREGERIYSQLPEEIIKGVYVSKKGKYEYWNGKKVEAIQDIKLACNSVIVLATGIEAYQRQMLEMLEEYDVDIYVSELVFQNHIIDATFFQSIALAVRESKKIWIVGSNNGRSQIIIDILERYQVKIEGKVYIDSPDGWNQLYGLADEDIVNTMVVISEEDKIKIERICDTLDMIGFSMEQFSYTSIYNVHTYKRQNAIHASRDTLLNYSLCNNEQFPGIVVVGKEEKNAIKILFLGGSTSTTGVYRTKSCVEYLYDNMVRAGYSVTIYNASLCGAESVDELLHLLRDGDHLRPDYVINLTGINDLYSQNIKNRFMMRYQHALYTRQGMDNGIESDETAYEFWLKMIKLKALYCDFIQSKFFAFLQPVNMAKSDKTLFETNIFEIVDEIENAKQFKSVAEREVKKIYINLMSIFENRGGMYIDACHYSNEGNRIIAEKIYEKMMSTEKEVFENSRK